jgi:hypothetical protein
MAKGLLGLFVGAIVNIGLSASLVAKDHDNKIAIAHLCVVGHQKSSLPMLVTINLSPGSHCPRHLLPSGSLHHR